MPGVLLVLAAAAPAPACERTTIAAVQAREPDVIVMISGFGHYTMETVVQPPSLRRIQGAAA